MHVWLIRVLTSKGCLLRLVGYYCITIDRLVSNKLYVSLSVFVGRVRAFRNSGTALKREVREQHEILKGLYMHPLSGHSLRRLALSRCR